MKWERRLCKLPLSRSTVESGWKTTPFANLPITDDAWNPDGASDADIENEILGSDENWDRYKKAHLAFAPGDGRGDPPADKRAYKLKIARLQDGQLTVYMQFLDTRLALLNGAREGVDLPAAVKAEAFAHGLRYYAKAGIPEEKRPVYQEPGRSSASPANSHEPIRARGYAAVYYNPADPGTEYQLDEDFYERIARGAFDRAIGEQDEVLGLINHDPNLILGRTGNGTVCLKSDPVGLGYEIDVPGTSYGRDLAISLARGDMLGSSFLFRVDDQQFTKENTPQGTRFIRTILSCRLRDVSVCSMPAYAATTAGLTGVGRCAIAKAELRAWKTTEFAALKLRELACRVAERA